MKNKIGEKIDLKTFGICLFDPRITIKQLKSNIQKFWCWGATAWLSDQNNSQLSTFLRFYVTGRKFTGHICIRLNGLDLYDIFYCSLRGTIKKIDTDVYGEDICDRIDNEIEKISAYVF